MVARFERFVLPTNLLDELSAHGSHTADKQIEHLVFGEEERVVDDVEYLAQTLALHHKRDVGFARPLCAGDDADAASPQSAEKLAGASGQILHIGSHDGHGGQTALDVHGKHGTVFDFGGKGFVEHLRCLVGIFVAHTDAGGVLRRCLRHHEHADAPIGQGGEDAAVDANHTHHREAGDRDERRAVDGADAFDGLMVVGNLGLDGGAGIGGVEGVFNFDGNVFHANGIDGGRIDHLGAEVAQLHGLDVAELGNGVGAFDDAWVGCHKAVDVGPNL